jgi:hypothetical protein
MNNYSIVRIGNDYVVRANENNILKTASLRIAERTVADAAELLKLHGSPSLSPGVAGPSIVRDPRVTRDPRRHT